MKAFIFKYEALKLAGLYFDQIAIFNLVPRLQYAALNLDFLNSFEMLGKRMSISLKKKCFMDEETFLKCEKQD